MPEVEEHFEIVDKIGEGNPAVQSSGFSADLPLNKY